jgi:SAM-dependent methyltransferase
MTAARVVMPEILDALPPEDPRAIRSRRDLVLVNALMGNARALASALEDPGRSRVSRADATLHVLELGGGSGRLLASVARRVGPCRVEATLVDLHPCVAPETRARLQARGWKLQVAQVDAFDWLAASHETYDAIVANLFLHHFEDAALRRLLQLAARRTRRFIACEPRRSRFAEWGAHLLPLLGCNDVTRHDSVVSVRAGFRDRELSASWPGEGWLLREGRHGLFSHRFVAWRA